MSGPDAPVPVAVLGATGTVGRRLVRMLAGHPWFRLSALLASERSAGKTFREATPVAGPIPDDASGRTVERVGEPVDAPVVFSALPSDEARRAEPDYAGRGHLVVTNASAHRMEEGVPLLVPEVNPGHMALLHDRWPGKGAIVANPNCSTAGLSVALAPLDRAFGVEAVHVVTLQAASGAGYPGVASLDLLENVIPFVDGEEEKLERETRRIFGRLDDRGRVQPAGIRLSAQCTRVPVLDGHTACVSVELASAPSLGEVRDAWDGYRGRPQELGLPTAPERPVVYREGEDHPQPRLHRDAGGGMTVSVGRLRPCGLLDLRFVCVSHNLVRGAAGGALLCAEAAIAEATGKPAGGAG